MRIAFLGATSQIAKDLVRMMLSEGQHDLFLYARHPAAITQWLSQLDKVYLCQVGDFRDFQKAAAFDAILNFVGVGNPAKAMALGADIFEITLMADGMALEHLRKFSQCRYLFLSSGAAYGAGFAKPADDHTCAEIALNNLRPQDWYGVSKLHAECRHRALPDLAIFDIRIFNYFSRTQDISARFLITDIIRHITEKRVLLTSDDYIVRDYLNPRDFQQLIALLLNTPRTNTVLDCYSKAPIDKPTLLATMRDTFGLQYEISEKAGVVNATGTKPYYYSNNLRASQFGYKPEKTSLEGIIEESVALLSNTLKPS